MPKVTMTHLRRPKTGQAYSDPAVSGLRYRTKTGGLYAELRYKNGGGTWRATALGRIPTGEQEIDALLDQVSEEVDYPGWRPGLDDVLREVREKAREEAKRIKQGEDPRSQGTLGAVVDRYLKDIEPERRQRTFKEIERHLRRDWSDLHRRPLAQLSRREIAEHLDTLKETKGPVARNRARASLRTLFQWAIERDLAPANPVDGTSKVPETARKRVLSDAEIKEVWAATAGDCDYHRIVRLCLATGQRDGRVGALRWSELDLEAARWSLPATQTKNKEPVSVPLNRPAIEIIEATKRRQGRDFLFGEGEGSYSGWSRSKRRLDGRIARQRAERRLGRALARGEKPEPSDHLPHWTLHDLRRTMRTNLGRLRVPREIRELAIGHAVQGIEAVYDLWTYEDEKREALEKWAGLLREIIGEGEPSNVVPIRA